MPLAELISYIITILGLFIILTLVAVKDIRGKLNISFIPFNAAVLLYMLASFAAEIPASLDSALWLTRLALFFGNLVPASFYFFSLVFTAKKYEKKWVTQLVYICLPILSILAFLPQNIIAVARYTYGTVIDDSGWLFLLTLVYFVIVFTISFAMLLKQSKISTRVIKLQTRLIVFGVGIGASVNMITQIILPQLGIKDWGNIIGNPSVIILVGSVGYAILKHHMFDIKTAILRSVSFLYIVAITTTLFAIILLGVGSVIFPDLRLSLAQAIYFVSVCVALALVYRPVVAWLENQTKRMFFIDRYDTRELLNAVSSFLSSDVEIIKLCAGSCKIISDYLNIENIDIIVTHNHAIYHSTSDQKLLPTHEELLELGSNNLNTDEMTDSNQKEILKKYGVNLYVVLKNQGDVIGNMLVGPRRSGSVYNAKDASTFATIGDELGVALSNSLSYIQIREFNKTLQEKVDAATEELKIANQKLKQADATKDDFISMASHQLTTPIASIEGYLSLANNGFLGKVSPKLSEALTSAADRTRVMKGLINDLLTVSRMQAGKFILDLSDVDIAKLAETEVELAQPMAKENKLTLRFHKPSKKIAAIACDEQKIRQVIVNFLTNAISYTVGGKVDVYMYQRKVGVELLVRDSGIGVPESQQANLFQKFYRADNAIKQRPNGNGIGLYLAKHVIQDHGGDLIFESVENKGSTFGFLLHSKPSAQQNTSTADKPGSTEANSTPQKIISPD